MQTIEKELFQVLRNNFNNRNSEFYLQHRFQVVNSHTIAPYYPKICVMRDADGTTILGVRTPKGFNDVLLKNNEYQKHYRYKWNTGNPIFNNQALVACVFTPQNPHDPHESHSSIFGFQSGLITCVDHDSKEILNVFNEGNKRSSLCKRASVRLVAVLPQYLTEFIVVFEDSTSMRYKLKGKPDNRTFLKKIKKFEKKTNFNPKLNRFEPQKKTRSKHFFFSCYLDEKKMEFGYFNAVNKHPVNQNPVAYYKFNHKDISDLVVRSHPSFEKTVLRHYTNKENNNMILALTSRDGYLVIYELNTMKPLLSYKAQSGGFNSLAFSENCEIIALSGPDEYITVLDLYTMTTLRCVEGHKFLVSRAIFQNIQIDTGRQDQESEEEATKGQRQSRWMQIIGGGMDGMLSFWEFKTDMFGLVRADIEESQLPLRLHSGNISKSQVIRPIHLEMFSDAIGWVEMFDDMLLVCKYDGLIHQLQSRPFNLSA